MSTEFRPRANQREIASYSGGRMAITAVPGGGKTHTLSYLAAELITRRTLRRDQEVLVVTLVNSAVDNFAGRVAEFMRSRGLLPNVGYRVRTLHSLAHEIVRGRPEIGGLSEDFDILDDLAAERIFQSVCDAWVRGHPKTLDQFLAEGVESKNLGYIRRRGWPDQVKAIAMALIRQAKDLQLGPDDWEERMGSPYRASPLLVMGYEIYRDYQEALAYHGAVDFDDLIAQALTILRSDQAYLDRLRDRWPFVLEDEAQDSSRLQESLLRILSGDTGNWVRVGDPNQAIYETFTTASPHYLRDFSGESGVIARELPQSGRSTASIMKLANYLIQWTQLEHPDPDLREALTPPLIESTPPSDPQPNPPDDPAGIRLIPTAYAPEEEVADVAKSASAWLRSHPESTLAVLVPTNFLGFDYVRALEASGVECIELLRSTRATRATAERLSRALRLIGAPTSTRELSAAFASWGSSPRVSVEAPVDLEQAQVDLRGCRVVEAYLWPEPDNDWLADLEVRAGQTSALELLHRFRRTCQRWQRAALLPIDQLLLIVAHDLLHEAADLALAHKLSGVLRRAAEQNPSWGLLELAGELDAVAQNERRFLGLSKEDLGFDPDRYPGKAVVATVHKAKGLEWDRVYLVSVNSYDFPSAQFGDRYLTEKDYIRDSLNLQAEALAQLQSMVSGSSPGADGEGQATLSARKDYAAERLRLLYVGITRARRELTITWNTGRHGDMQQSLPFLALETYWKGIADDAVS